MKHINQVKNTEDTLYNYHGFLNTNTFTKHLLLCFKLVFYREKKCACIACLLLDIPETTITHIFFFYSLVCCWTYLRDTK